MVLRLFLVSSLMIARDHSAWAKFIRDRFPNRLKTRIKLRVLSSSKPEECRFKSLMRNQKHYNIMP